MYSKPTESIISFKQISKCYPIYSRPSDRLKQMIWRGRKSFYKDFWALKEVSFEVLKGQTIGIIGRNGSGKSTILQIIAGTLTPTKGSLQVAGRIAALLELGSGFNPEFTGRENAIMNCTIMGLSKAEIKSVLPFIEQFAEVGEFIDQPVKVYSSGMYLRLAFACAVHVNPDILIIDEALAVGDAQFQLKCMDKMKSFKQAGKTILFVSHDSYVIRNFCDQVIWMKQGRICMQGAANQVVENYQDEMNKTAAMDFPDSENTDKGEKALSIRKVYFLNEKGERQNTFEFPAKLTVTVEYTLHREIKGTVGGIALYDRQNHYISGLNTKLDQVILAESPGDHKLSLTYANLNLMPGTYYMDIGFFESSAVVPLDYRSKLDAFTITSGEYFGEGLLYVKHYWNGGGLKTDVQI